MKRRRINPDAWWYIERPFPWLLLAWPLLWLWSTLREVFRPRVLWGGGPVFIDTEAPVGTFRTGLIRVGEGLPLEYGVDYWLGTETTKPWLIYREGDGSIQTYTKRGPAGEPVVVYLHPESGR